MNLELIPCWHQETRYELTTLEWPVLIRPRVAGFEVTGDTIANDLLFVYQVFFLAGLEKHEPLQVQQPRRTE
jgi:hypothetical protein